MFSPHVASNSGKTSEARRLEEVEEEKKIQNKMSFFARAKDKIEGIVNNKKKGNQHTVLQSEFGSTVPRQSNGSGAQDPSHRGSSPTVSTTISDDTASQGHYTPSRAGPTAQENSIVEELTADDIDLDKLKRLCWSGCPDGFRAECWGVLTGYYPLNHANREVFMRRKRAEYQSYVVSTYSNVNWSRLLELGNNEGSMGDTSDPTGSQEDGSSLVGVEELAIMKQIRKDLPRAGNVKVLHCVRIQQIMERVLYIWAVRHPACGYVQGMNDLVYPFLYVLLVDHVAGANSRVSYFVGQKSVEEAEEALRTVGGSTTPSFGHSSDTPRLQQQVQQLQVATATAENEAESGKRKGGSPTSPGPTSPRSSEADWANFEADLYWNVSRVMEKVQANYTFNQSGCHAMVKKLEELCKVVDPALHKHLTEKLQIQFFNFGFRWMNCLLLRELNPMQALRLWDTYLCEEDYSGFHVYVCCELLVRWSSQIRKIGDSGDALSFLQTPPTHLFHDRDLDEVVAAAFVLQQTYDKSFKHLLECQEGGSASKRAPSSSSSLGGLSNRSSD